MANDTEAARMLASDAGWRAVDEAIRWALEEQTTRRSSERLVLIALCYRIEPDGSARLSISDLCDLTRLSRSTVKSAIGGLCGLGLVETVDRGPGRTAEYVVDLGRGVVENRPGSESLSVASHNALERQEQRLEPPDGGSMTSAPPTAVRVRGRDLVYDAVAVACGIQQGSPRAKSIPAALNGEDGIRAQAWREVQDTTGQESPSVEPEAYERWLAREVEVRAALYRQKLAGAALTPSALKKWWTDLPSMVTPSKHGTAEDALAIATAARRAARGEG